MEEKILISVIIPVYKVEKYIEKCIFSVLNQDFSSLEIILVDDGSPDTCPNICDSIAKENDNVKVIHKANEGVSIARKTGVKAAKGEYILCIDGDDWIGTGCLKDIADCIAKTEADIICYGSYYEKGGTFYRYKTNYRIGVYEKENIIKEIYPSLIQKEDASYFAPNIWGKVIKKNLLLPNMIADSRCNIGEDFACIVPCIYNSDKIVIIDKYYYFYRSNNQSLTKKRHEIGWEWSKIVKKHVEEHINIEDYNFKDQLNRKIVHDLFSIIKSQFYCADSYQNIKRIIEKNINEKIYRYAITNCRFKRCTLASLMHFFLRHKFYCIFYLYSKL